MKYYAVQMSSDRWKGGFDTEEAAWKYIHVWRCKGCREEDPKGEQNTQCDAEWDVWTEQDVTDCGPLPPEGEQK